MYFFLQSSRYVSNEQPCLKTTGLCDDLLLLSSLFHQRRQWHSTSVLLPGKSHGWRSLVGCSPWGLEGSDTTERLHFHFSLSFIGEGNDNPLQCSCLENPRDGGAWWAAIYGVAQSRTRLKRLSSSSSLFHFFCSIFNAPISFSLFPNFSFSFFSKVLSQAFIKHRRKAFVYIL